MVWVSPVQHGAKPEVGIINEAPLTDRSLINVLRQNGIQPVAIWDERGVRDWKAPEVGRVLIILLCRDQKILLD